MKLGAFDLTLVSDGEFRLDGGAMFGVVPRVLWQEKKAPDEQNRIPMATNCLLVARGDDLVLIDAGIGDKHDRRFAEMFALEEGALRLPDAIRRAGYELGDVTHVVLTHLHFDHCGWSTRERDGRLTPTFPRATYWLDRLEVAHAEAPNERDRSSYDPRNWQPLFEAGVVEVFDGQAEPVPGISALRTPGHTDGMAIVLIDGGNGEKAVFWADLVPTAAHVPYPWIMSYDLYPMTTLENKQRWLPKAAEEGWLSIFEHDTDCPMGRLVLARPGRYQAEPLAAVPAG